MEEGKVDEGRMHERDWESHMEKGIKGMRSDMMDRMKDFPTKGFWVHIKAANREMLLAARSVLDMAIDKLEEEPEEEEPKSGRITIE